jgi:hypothetical protein
MRRAPSPGDGRSIFKQFGLVRPEWRGRHDYHWDLAVLLAGQYTVQYIRKSDIAKSLSQQVKLDAPELEACCQCY